MTALPPPTLHVTIGGRPWATVEPPADFGPREWLLGVVAVQVFWTPGEGLSARVRAHKTGEAQARERPLGPGEPVVAWISTAGAGAAAAAEGIVVQASMGDLSGQVPTVAPLGASRGPTSLAAYLGDALLARADLPHGAGTPLRAFGHAFVRWRRDAPAETGVDLTGFSPPGSGDMYGRLRSDPLPVGVPATYVLDWGLARG